MLHADWSTTGTLKELRKYHSGFRCIKEAGWYESETDTLLVQTMEGFKGKYGSEEPEGEPRFRVHVYNRPGVRSEMADLLAMPVKVVK